jgi:hypothetical protein
MTQAQRLVGGGVVVFVAAGLCSCSGGDSLNPVSGKVLHQKQPLPGALVTFHPKNSALNAPRPTGLTKEDGSFTLTTGDKEGAPAGDYTITIICSEIPKKESKVFMTGGVDTVDRLKGTYANMAESKIHVTVKSGDNLLEPFDLK